MEAPPPKCVHPRYKNDKSEKYMPLNTEYHFIVSSFRCLICKTYFLVKVHGESI